MKSKIALVLCLSANLLLVACGTDAPTSQDQLDVVATSYQPNYRFQDAQTYALPSQVAVISDAGSTAQTLDPALSQNVLQSIRNQLNSRGYTEDTSNSQSSPPSIFVEVSKMNTTTTQVYYDYWYGYYGGYYAPYYGSAYGVGWAPVTVPYVIEATVGSLIINVTDPNHPDQGDKKIPSVWASVINGVIDNSSQADIQQRVDAGIQQAFAQSPYFTRSTP
ncbi:MAG: DUF4136 domain-containing protein [Bdellovibrionia bacterium]